MKRFYATGIEYDLDGNEDPGLPTDMEVECEDEDLVADAISDSTGWLVESIDEIHEV